MYFSEREELSRLFLVILVSIIGVKSDEVLVQTNVGAIRGLRASDGNYSMFLGIPYAKVDERNPFGPSTPFPKFDEAFEAIDDSVVCPQIEEFNGTVVGSLDCLNLNVYVPDGASIQNPTAVLVWIYGGSFAIGFASRYIHGPKYLVRHDVILVTLNYRLGPYGFMCLHTPEVPGNQGLKDQLAALRWVKENIAAFGGDVDRITLFGESAGAVSVDLHVVSEQEKLFNSVIMQSGSSFNPRNTRIPVTTAPVEIASRLGFTTGNVDEALAFISTVDPHVIIATAAETDIVFRPCVEKDFENVEKFVRDYTINIDRLDKSENMSVLLGFNNDELIVAYALISPEAFGGLDEFYDRLNVSFTFEEDMLESAEATLRNFYIGDEEHSQLVMQQLSDFASDYQYINPTQRCIKNYLQNGAEKVFYYAFSYSGNRNFVKRRLGVTMGGAAHADDLGYLFDMQIFPEEPAVEDQLIIDRVTTMWANFAKYGDPTPETTALLPVKWEPITKNSPYHFLNITLDMELGRRPFQQRLAFWDLFYKTYGEFEEHYNRNGVLSLSENIGLLMNLVTILLVYLFI